MIGKCRNCEFCFPHQEFGFVCADANYGEDISKSLDQEKHCYSEGLDAFIERSKKEEIAFIPGTKLVQLKIDGRKQIELTDQEGKTIKIKASKAREMLGEIEVQRIQIEGVYIVNAIFDHKAFNGARYLIIK